MRARNDRDPEVSIFSAVRTAKSEEVFTRADLDLSVTGANGQSLLHEAIAFQRSDIAKELIERKIDVNWKNRNGQTPLHYAVTYNNAEVIELLVRAGASCNQVDKYGNTPLWTAVLGAKGNYEIVRSLVKHGADPAMKNSAGRSPLDFAAQSKNGELLKILGHAHGE